MLFFKYSTLISCFFSEMFLVGLQKQFCIILLSEDFIELLPYSQSEGLVYYPYICKSCNFMESFGRFYAIFRIFSIIKVSLTIVFFCIKCKSKKTCFIFV